MSVRFHVLLIDDDFRLRDLLKRFLEESGFKVTDVESTNEARKILKSTNFDVMILDVMMPGETGVEFLVSLRNKLNLPVLLLTAMNETEDRINGLEAGADDYLSKPFEPKELILRIKNILSKTKIKNIKRVITFGNVKIDLKKLLILKENKQFKINDTEKKILEKMINSPGQTFSREDIAKIINLEKERSIDVIITRLRKKIEKDSKNPRYLQTKRGEGYVLWIE